MFSHGSFCLTDCVCSQSSAAVHGGNSGGMLLNAEGTILGMVTSNVRHTPPPNSDDDVRLPHRSSSPSSFVVAICVLTVVSLWGAQAATKKAKDKQSEEGGALLVELNFSMPLVALEELMQVAGIFDPTLMMEHELMDLEMQAELDEPDDQLAALWALNLEQEREYKVKVDTPPGGPRFQKFMEEFQVRTAHPTLFCIVVVSRGGARRG